MPHTRKLKAKTRNNNRSSDVIIRIGSNFTENVSCKLTQPIVNIAYSSLCTLSGPSLPVPVELVSGDGFIDAPECVDAPEC